MIRHGWSITEHTQTHTQRTIQMTPYELRFAIFQQAQTLAHNEYDAAYSSAAMWNDNPKTTVLMDYPEFPSYEYIESLADKMNKFVSEKQ